MSIEERIVAVLDNIRPYLISEGGNIEFIKYENGVVYVSMKGACANCGMVDVTLKEGIEAILVDEISEVKEVISI